MKPILRNTIIMCSVAIALSGCGISSIKIHDIQTGKTRAIKSTGAYRDYLASVDEKQGFFSTICYTTDDRVQLKKTDYSGKILSKKTLPANTVLYPQFKFWYAVNTRGDALVYFNHETTGLNYLNLNDMSNVSLCTNIGVNGVDIKYITWISETNVLVAFMDEIQTETNEAEIAIVDVVNKTYDIIYKVYNKTLDDFVLSKTKRYLALAGHEYIFGLPGAITILDLNTGTIVSTIHSSTGKDLLRFPALSPNDQLLAFTEKNKIILYNIDTKERKTIKSNGGSARILFLDNNTLLFKIIDSSQLCSLDINTNKETYISSGGSGSDAVCHAFDVMVIDAGKKIIYED